MKELVGVINTYELGLEDGLFGRTQERVMDEWTDNERFAYHRAYSHGVWLYCEIIERGIE